MSVRYQALFREGPWDGRQILVIDEKLLEEITVLEEEPEITELLAELGLSDEVDPVRFDYLLIGFLPQLNSFLYVPKTRIKAADQ